MRAGEGRLSLTCFTLGTKTASTDPKFLYERNSKILDKPDFFLDETRIDELQEQQKFQKYVRSRMFLPSCL